MDRGSWHCTGDRDQDHSERVTGRKARGLQTEEIGWKCQTFLSLLNSSTLATSCEVLTHCKRLCCWEGLQAGGEGDDRGWDGWMASLTRWTWVWANSGSWWWTGRPVVLRFMGSQRVRHDWATELNWTEEAGGNKPAIDFSISNL